MKKREVQSKNSKLKKGILFIIQTFLLLIVFLFLFLRVFSLNTIEMESMEPNISGITVGNRLAYKAKDPKRGEVIIFTKDGVQYIKRIIALPGETISFFGGEVFIDDKMLIEEYLPDGVKTECAQTFTVPDGMYFCLGDNRDYSMDSRHFIDPYISRNAIVAKVFWDFDSFPGHAVGVSDEVA